MSENEADRKALRRTFDIAEDLLDAERDEEVVPYRSADELAEGLGLELGEPTSEDLVFEVLRKLVLATPRSATPRFFNQLFGGRDPVATSAEMLSVLLNTSMYTYKVAGPQVLVEREVTLHMARMAGFSEGEGIFTAGGSISNLTAILLARNERFPEARDAGLHEPVGIYTSEESHYSVRKSAGVLGLGRDSVRAIAVDERGRMSVSALQAAVLEDRSRGVLPLFVNATAGTTVRGAFDPIEAIADVAAEHDLWMHVDGALGGSVLLSAQHRELLRGVERADSMTWNPHKMMGVPLVCSAFLTRSSGLLRKHLDEAAGYLFQGDEEELDPGHRSLQCGRRNDALKLWAAWKRHGDRGWGKRIDYLFELADYAAERVAAEADLSLVERPSSINVCFAVPGVSSVDICESLHREGRAMVGYGEVAGRTAIRLVCANADAERRDLDAFFADVMKVAASLRREPAAARG